MSSERPTERHDGTHVTRVEAHDAPRPARRVLRVLLDDGVRSIELAEGTHVLGRSAEAGVVIDAGSVSRTHATLHVGKTLQLEDMGSANGTRVRGVALEPGRRVDVLPGDEIHFGKVLCIVQGGPRGPSSAPLRALRTHEYFEARLDDECARSLAKTDGGALQRALRDELGPGGAESFSIVRLRVEGAFDAGFEPTLVAATRASEVVAWYGPGEYEVLLPGVASAGERVAALTAALLRGGWLVRAGTATYPRDGRTTDELIEKAGDGLRLAAPQEAAAQRGDLVVEDPEMRRLYDLLARVAALDISVLLLGEMGTGKEVFASQLHKLSPRRDGPFRAINCAAFTETLIEGELFGHEKGVFTGATAAKAGLLEGASGGTVFLDEVGELSPSFQAKLLRVLEERKVRRVGGHAERPIDVRFVAATNRDLERAVEEGVFRGDLYFRLNGFSFDIPPLRERVGEIIPLARRFLAMASSQARRERVPQLSPEALTLMQQHRWPGNVRELRNEMTRAVILADGDVVTPEHLSAAKMRSLSRLAKPAPGPAAAPSSPPPPAATTESPYASLTLDTIRPLAEVRAEVEKLYVRRVLELCLHNQTRAAEALGISRAQVVSLIERYSLPRPRA